MRMMTVITLSLALIGGALSASAKSGLYQEKDINDRLLVIAVGDKIRRACGDISTRYIAARAYANGTMDLAKSRGYSEVEINRYIEDKANKAEMRERRNRYFEANGATNLNAESLCALGHAEIEKNSQIGVLLRAW